MRWKSQTIQVSVLDSHLTKNLLTNIHNSIIINGYNIPIICNIKINGRVRMNKHLLYNHEMALGMMISLFVLSSTHSVGNLLIDSSNPINDNSDRNVLCATDMDNRTLIKDVSNNANPGDAAFVYGAPSPHHKKSIMENSKSINLNGYSLLEQFFLSYHSSHLIYGTAIYEDGITPTGVQVYVVSSLSTLIGVVYSGNWQVDCGDPGPNWPKGTAFAVYIIGCCSHRGWFGSTSDVVSGDSNNVGNIVLYPNNNPNSPDIPAGPIFRQIGVSGIYITNATDPNDLNEVKYRFDWDAGGYHEYSNFTEFVDNGMPASKSHSWNTPGTYVVKAQARDEYEAESEWSDGLTVIVFEHDNPPETPTIDGPISGRMGNEYLYTITTTDQDNDDIDYIIDWGDGNDSGWIGPYESGEELVVAHTWNERGTYEIIAKAKDVYDEESPWSEPHTMHITAPEIKIDGIYGGLFKIHVDISNIGDGIVTDVDWNILLSGGRVISGENTSGTIKDMAPGNRITVTSELIFGISMNAVVTVNANIEGGNADRMETEAAILFFFILMYT